MINLFYPVITLLLNINCKMEKTLKEIINEIGKENEMKDELINEIIEKLEKEFYIKLKHMKNLSLETWKSLELPINLFYVLNEFYQSTLSEQEKEKPPQPIIKEKEEEKQNIIPQQISYITSSQPILIKMTFFKIV